MITEERLRGLWRQYHPKPIILSEWELALYRAVEAEARDHWLPEMEGLQERAERAEADYARLRKLMDDAEAVIRRQKAERDVLRESNERLRAALIEALSALNSNEDTCIEFADLRGRIAALAGEKP